MWQLAFVAGPVSVDTTNLAEGYVYFEIFVGRPAMAGIHGSVDGCSEFWDAVSLKQATVHVDEQLPQASVSCKTNVPAIVTLGRALTVAGVEYVVNGDQLVLTLADGTAMTFKRSYAR